MDILFIILGENAFRIPTDSSKRRPVSMTLFESLFYFFRLLSDDETEFKSNSVRKAVTEMLEDSVFLQALTYNVDSAVHVEERFSIVTQKYRELVDVK